MLNCMQGRLEVISKKNMEIVRVGIYVSDIEYGRALAKALAIETRKMEFILTDEEYIRAEGLFDLVLTDSSETECDICLTEEQQKEIYLQEQPYSVYKYLNSCKLAEALCYVYYRKTGKALKGQKKRKFRLVTGVSSRGESGLSLSLISAAEALAALYQAKCLFFSLCPYNEAVPVEGKSEKGCFIKFLYYLQCKEDFSISMFINETDNVDFLAVEKLNPAYVEMKKETLSELIKRVEETGNYDFLIVDIGNHISVRSLNFVAESDAVIFADNTNKVPTIKLLRDFNNGPLCIIKNAADNILFHKQEESRSDFIETRFNIAEGGQKSYGNGALEIAEWIVENTGYENEKLFR